MKKLSLTTLAIFIGLTYVTAQDIAENAIGLRLGASDGFNTEVSYQRALGDSNRLEIDFGWRSGNDSDGFKLTGLYQWVWELEGDFNWYAGPGIGLSSNSYNDSSNYNDTFVFIAGDVGIEYSFDFPLMLSLDIRPELGFGSDRYNNNDLDFGIALGVRYQF